MCLNFSELTTTQDHISEPVAQNDDAVKTAVSLVTLQKEIGLNLIVKDQNLHTITGRFNNMADLLYNPEFISHINQEIYVSDHNESTWFKMKLKRGKFESITFLLTMKVNWVKILNKCHDDFDAIIVGYFPGAENVTAATTAIPRGNFTPERILKHFPYLIGETANDHKEVGKLICYILSKYLNNPTPNM